MDPGRRRDHVVLDMGTTARHTGGTQDGFLDDLYPGVGAVDGTPRALALIGFGAILTIFLLKLGGFRFSFGVGVGGGAT